VKPAYPGSIQRFVQGWSKCGGVGVASTERRHLFSSFVEDSMYPCLGDTRSSCAPPTHTMIEALR
jgi:hypothetical protein